MSDDSVKYVAPDSPSKCKWSLDKSKSSTDPHHHVHVETEKIPKIMKNVLEQIGNTPLIRLNYIPQKYGIKCEMLVKCEFFNAGGSVKDRIGLRMIEDAEREGLIKPGWTIIEPTSGNTGIGLALGCAIKGYKCVIVMPEKMSKEKNDILHALGAEIIRTPTSARYDAPNSHIRIAQKLNHQIKDSIILDQYRNAGNPLAHYDGTAEEILKQCDKRIDMIVLGAGTGGTVAGIGRKFKEVIPDCRVIGVDPLGSILAHPETPNEEDVTFYEVEGIGYDFIPTVLDRSVVDRWIKTADKEAFLMARELIMHEGLLCGGSSGTAMVAALEAAKELKEGQRCVVLLPDGVRNYMSKFLDDNWMEERNFQENLNKESHLKKPWFWEESVNNLVQGMTVESVTVNTTSFDAIKLMKRHGYDQLAVLNAENGFLTGMVTVGQIMTKIASGYVTMESTVREVMLTDFPKIERTAKMGVLSAMLKTNPYVVVIDHVSGSEERIAGIITHIDILNYLAELDSFEQ